MATLKLKQRDELAQLREQLNELQQCYLILQKRLAHTDGELAQARVSRDSWKARYCAITQGGGNEKPREVPGLDASTEGS